MKKKIIIFVMLLTLFKSNVTCNLNLNKYWAEEQVTPIIINNIVNLERA